MLYGEETTSGCKVCCSAADKDVSRFTLVTLWSLEIMRLHSAYGIKLFKGCYDNRAQV